VSLVPGLNVAEEREIIRPNSLWASRLPGSRFRMSWASMTASRMRRSWHKVQPAPTVRYPEVGSASMARRYSSIALFASSLRHQATCSSTVSQG